MNLLLLGMSHRTAALALRERFAVEDPRPALCKLVAAPEVEEAALVSTCNRIEILVLSHQPEAARLLLRRFLQRDLLDGEGQVDSQELDAALYSYEDANAVRHVFRVACSVDSLVIGEPQILGQVKAAYRASVECGACGPILGRLFQRAFGTAKRVRNETRIAQRPVSVARVAVDLARQIFESLEGKAALLVGAGDMIELALESLQSAGLGSVHVANRSPARAEALATRFGASAHGLDEIPLLLARSDVVLTCIGGDVPILTPAIVEEALRKRRQRPIFAIDIGVPRNVHPDVDRLDGVYRYDLDDLEGVAQTNAQERHREVAHAEAIVSEEQQRFDGWLSALSAVPTIRALRGRAESIRRGELARGLTGLSLAEGERRAVEAITRAIVNKILHAPISMLRRERDREAGLAHLEAARNLFALDDPEAPGAEADEPATEGRTSSEEDAS